MEVAKEGTSLYVPLLSHLSSSSKLTPRFCSRAALRLAAAKLPVRTEFITRATGARLGNLSLDDAALATAAVVASPTLPASDEAAVAGASALHKEA